MNTTIPTDRQRQEADNDEEWPMVHWYEHLGSMLGGGIAFHTAFAVFGIQRFIDYDLSGIVGLLPWIAPTVVGTVAITLWTRYYRRKFVSLAPEKATPV